MLQFPPQGKLALRKERVIEIKNDILDSHRFQSIKILKCREQVNPAIFLFLREGAHHNQHRFFRGKAKEGASVDYQWITLKKH
jgi:hypothetical protein